MSENRLSPARKKFADAVRKDPSDFMAHYNLGVACGEEGDIEAALASFQELASLEPTHALAWFNAGCILLELQRIPEAIEAFKSAVVSDMQMAPAHFMLGTAYGALGDDAAALDATQRGLELDPADPQAQMNAGRAAYGCGNLDQALVHYREACRLTPYATPAWIYLARCSRELEKIDDALNAAVTAVNLEPDHYLALFMVGVYHAEVRTGRTPSVTLSRAGNAFELQNPEHRFLYALGLWAMGANDQAQEEAALLQRADPKLAEELKEYFK